MFSKGSCLVINYGTTDDVISEEVLVIEVEYLPNFICEVTVQDCDGFTFNIYYDELTEIWMLSSLERLLSVEELGDL